MHVCMHAHSRVLIALVTSAREGPRKCVSVGMARGRNMYFQTDAELRFEPQVYMKDLRLAVVCLFILAAAFFL